MEIHTNRVTKRAVYLGTGDTVIGATEIIESHNKLGHHIAIQKIKVTVGRQSHQELPVDEKTLDKLKNKSVALGGKRSELLGVVDPKPKNVSIKP